MKPFRLFCLGTSLVLAAPLPALAQAETTPSAEQAEADEMQQAIAMLGAMFPAEPLSAEQEARLPQAQRIIARMIPEGTLAEMMGSMFDKMLGPVMQMGESPAIGTVSKAIGLSARELDLTAEQSEELAGIFDPAWAERQKREIAMFPGMMTDMMNAMEPGMRKAMAELYAINFSPTELAEIEAFFLTETGASYARKSFTMSSDPRIISATMDAVPAMMGTIGALEQKLSDATADLPAQRGFADLSGAEQARVAALTGYAVEDIKANLDAAGSTVVEPDASGDASAEAAAAAASSAE